MDKSLRADQKLSPTAKTTSSPRITIKKTRQSVFKKRIWKKLEKENI
jgi:hypothetical protein